jgi:NADPH2:quinone reductase
LIPADRLLRLPDTIDYVTAASIMVRGLTAWYLIRRAYVVQPGDWILLNAAASGVGLILAQWAKHIGATVIGIVSSREKAEIAQSHGCDHIIDNTRESISERVRELSSGDGVAAAYDSVGRDTFGEVLDCLGALGHFVAFGAASGEVAPIDPLLLMRKGSIHFTRTSLRHYTRARTDLESGAAELFDLISTDKVEIKTNKFCGLDNIATAHREIESRRMTGSTVVEV